MEWGARGEKMGIKSRGAGEGSRRSRNGAGEEGIGRAVAGQGSRVIMESRQSGSRTGEQGKWGVMEVRRGDRETGGMNQTRSRRAGWKIKR